MSAGTAISGPTEATLTRPAITGRHQRLGLPMLPELLHQSRVDPSSRDHLHKEHIAGRDLHTVTLDDFCMGDKVWMQHHTTKQWYKTATVIKIRHGGVHTSLKIIRLNYTSAAGDFCDLMTVPLQAILAVRSIFVESAHFPNSTHREMPSLISLIPLHLLFTLL